MDRPFIAPMDRHAFPNSPDDLTSGHEAPIAIGDEVETIKGAKFWGLVIALDNDQASPGCTVLAIDPGFAGTKHVYPLRQLRRRRATAPCAVEVEWPDRLHPSHQTRVSDAGSFDEICDVCGATDVTGGGWGELRKPCRGSAK